MVTTQSGNPSEAKAPIQLKMNFSGDNPLANALRTGAFVILVEQNSPAREQPFDSAMALAVALSRRAGACGQVTGMAVTDRQKAEDSHDPVDCAALLAESSGKPCLMMLSGKGSSRDRLRDCLARAASRGLRNVLPVSGDRSDRHIVKRTPTGSFLPYEGGYFDSVAALALIRSSTTGLCAGAAVNPFKYNAADQYLQYYKMLRKLATGAQFLVTHAGWDMKKLQELQWFMEMREVSIPVLARVPLLSPSEIQVIHETYYPGVHMARLFYAMLQRESSLNPAQCLAAQLQRVGLHVAGCKLLGYSGVQLVGVKDAKTLDMVLAQIHTAMDKFHNYPDWLAAWNEFHNFIEFAPLHGGFYAFDGLLPPKKLTHFAAGTSTVTGHPWPAPRPADRGRSFCLRWMLHPSAPHWLDATGRLVGCGRCRHTGCGSRFSYQLCPRACPKGLAYGACGGSAPDGTCEFGFGPCFHHRVLALAASRHELDRLEEGITGD